jgi:hypothetical protein
MRKIMSTGCAQECTEITAVKKRKEERGEVLQRLQQR